MAVEEATWRKCTLHNSRKELSDLARHGGDTCISLENMEPLGRDAVQRMQQQLMSVPWSTTTVCGDPPSQRQERMEQTYGSDRPLAPLRSPCSRSLLASIFPKDSSKWADAQRVSYNPTQSNSLSDRSAHKQPPVPDAGVRGWASASLVRHGL